MSKSLRLPEKWFRRGLWLVAAAFAFFLIGLGSLVVGNLPQPNTSLEVEQFIPESDAQRVKAEINKAQALAEKTGRERDKAARRSADLRDEANKLRER